MRLLSALRGRRRWLLSGLYLLVLIAHHLWSHFEHPPLALRAGQESVQLEPVRGVARVAGEPVRVAYHDQGERNAVALLLLHGSPGSGSDFDAVRALLPADLRVLTVDLPGFGRSAPAVPDYSFRAHAAYVRELLDALEIERVHVVGFSMGGGVAIELERQEPGRVASIVLLAGLGVQEFELLGDHSVNHALHGAQLAAIWVLEHLIPHFGWWSDSPLSLAYARNFYDSDQRPLRDVLEQYDKPMLVMHGVDDFLVPLDAAREHLRIVPQAEATIFEDGSHFLVWSHAREVAQVLLDWTHRVDTGMAAEREDATAERVAASRLPLEQVRDLGATGMVKWLLLLLIVLGTFVSEDLTCIGTGLLIAQGRLTIVEGFSAAFVGIYFGDLLLYAVGRTLGFAVLGSAPWRWLIDAEDLRRAGRWFQRRGFWAILLTRIVPGTRLPTYLAAGIVRASFWRFAVYFLVAVLLWTPVIVGFAAVIGRGAIEHFEHFRQDSLWLFLVLLVSILVLLRVGLPLLSWRGRRLAVARWRRWQRWEFWPSWVLYAPVAWRALGHARRHGGFMVPTAVNPLMPASGVVGESKSTILDAFGEGHPRIAHFARLAGADDPAVRRIQVEAFLQRHSLGVPFVLKPDAGQRGQGVVIVREMHMLDALLESQPIDLVVQEYVPGEEFGIFYVRENEAESGRIISLTEKRPLVIEGDGQHTLEQLILRDDRAVLLAERHLRRHLDQLERVLAVGERFVVAELGTHARGSLFFDASDVLSPELERAIEELSRAARGFRFGRYDVRVTSRAHLRRGEDFKVIELNGLTSESTHMYDPRYGVRQAIDILQCQWELAYRIGADQVARGHRVAGVSEIVRSWWQQGRDRRFHAEDRIHVATRASGG